MNERHTWDRTIVHNEFMAGVGIMTVITGAAMSIIFCLCIMAAWVTKDERCARDMNPGTREPCSLRQVIAWEVGYLATLKL